MSVSSLADRLAVPLAWFTGAIFVLGASSAVVIEPAAPGIAAGRAGIDPAPGSVPAVGTTADTEPDTGATTPTPDDSPPAAADESPAPSPLGRAAAPAAGVHRYEVTTTDADGTVTVQEERREIEVLSGDRTTATVRISARLAGESQVSVLEWSPTAALVRSTRIESTGGVSQDCTWEPPFPELGTLQAGESWTLGSTCRTAVAGVDTRFSVTGEGRVLGEATVSFRGSDVRVWRIRRDRTTSIEAELDGQPVRQTARETGDLFFDPGRGLVLRSEVTITLGGTQTGTTRRVSVLQAE